MAKRTLTTSIDPELLDRSRDAVVALAGPPEFLNVARIVERGLRRELKLLEKRHNGGKPFPKREREPHTGRPVN